jgi:protein involved in polysaccharide export with SLBB domain
MKMKVGLFAILTLVLFQAAFGQVDSALTAKAARNTPTSDTQKNGYLIGPGDVITVNVLGEKDFDFVATVDEDGKFQVPFFKQGVTAKCRTEKELRTDVTLERQTQQPSAGGRLRRNPQTARSRFNPPRNTVGYDYISRWSDKRSRRIDTGFSSECADV